MPRLDAPHCDSGMLPILGKDPCFSKENSFLAFPSPPTHFSVISQGEKIKTLHFEHKDGGKERKAAEESLSASPHPQKSLFYSPLNEKLSSCETKAYG